MEKRKIILKNRLFIFGILISFLFINQTNADVISLNSYGSNEVVVTGWTEQVEGFFFGQKSTDSAIPHSEPKNKILKKINKTEEIPNGIIEKLKILNKTKEIQNETIISKTNEQDRKFYTFFLNSLRILDRLKKRLFLDPQDITKMIKDIEIIKDRFRIFAQKIKTQYISLIKYKTIESTKYFKNGFEEKNFYEIISPCIFLRDFTEDYGLNSRMSKIIERSKIIIIDLKLWVYNQFE